MRLSGGARVRSGFSCAVEALPFRPVLTSFRVANNTLPLCRCLLMMPPKLADKVGKVHLENLRDFVGRDDLRASLQATAPCEYCDQDTAQSGVGKRKRPLRRVAYIF